MELADYLRKTKKTHLIFDFDETILKLLLPWDDAFKRIRKELISLDEKTYGDYGSRKISFSLLQNKYVREFGKKILGNFIKNEIGFEREELRGVILNPKLLDFVKNSSSYEMFIWSSNAKPTIEKLLKQHGIFGKFKKIVSREDVSFLKPEVDGFELLHDVKIPKEKYLFIGDSVNDKLAAEKLGIDFFLVDFFHVKSNY